MAFNHRVALALALVIPAFVFAAQAPRPGESPLAITDVTLIDGTGTAARPHMTVTIADGRITAVAHNETLQPPPGAQIINGTGRFAIPGLWNMHVHSVGFEQASKAFPDVLAAGIVGIRDMGAPVDDVLRLRSDANEGRLRGPHMLVAGPLLARGIPPSMAGTTMLSAVSSVEQASEVVVSLKKRGCRFHQGRWLTDATGLFRSGGRGEAGEHVLRWAYSAGDQRKRSIERRPKEHRASRWTSSRGPARLLDS